MRRLIRWFFRLLATVLIVTVVAAVLILLMLNSILRVYVEHRIRAETGMSADIGDFSCSLSEPTVTIKNLKLYNTPEFGGALFLNVPDLHVEYDFAALKQHKLHIALLRFNLAELDVVKNETGRTNISSFPTSVKNFSSGKTLVTRGFEFTGIDVLNVSFGKARLIDLKKIGNNRDVTIGLQNMVLKNVKSEEDLYGLIGLIWLRGGGAVDLPNNPVKAKPATGTNP
jgi:hypothetical protein